MDVDSTTRTKPLPEYTHVAFSISAENFEKTRNQPKKSGFKIWKEIVSEGDSVYSLDLDGHKIEIHVGDLKTRIESIKKKPWNSSVEFF